MLDSDLHGYDLRWCNEHGVWHSTELADPDCFQEDEDD